MPYVLRERVTVLQRSCINDTLNIVRIIERLGEQGLASHGGCLMDSFQGFEAP